MCSAAFMLISCATQKPYATGKYDLPPKVPASFLESYPSGSQTRKIESVDLTFNNAYGDFFQLYQAGVSRKRTLRGQVTIALALDTDGVVQAVQVIDSELRDSEFEKAVLVRVRQLKFGPAEGKGLYVFWYALRFAPLPK